MESRLRSRPTRNITVLQIGSCSRSVLPIDDVGSKRDESVAALTRLFQAGGQLSNASDMVTDFAAEAGAFRKKGGGGHIGWTEIHSSYITADGFRKKARRTAHAGSGIKHVCMSCVISARFPNSTVAARPPTWNWSKAANFSAVSIEAG
jgi:hypothetical protein